MSKHIANKQQKKAFEDVVKAFAKAKKLGLVFYAKQDSIVAYTKEADKYANQKDFNEMLRGKGMQMPYLSNGYCINDSGADDYACYLTEEDEKKFNPDGY